MRQHTYSRYRPQLARQAATTQRIDFSETKLPMRDVAQRYGIEVDARGNCKCPFHNDHDPSMKLYDGARGWYCWVCNEGGDAVDFVQKLFSLSAPDAAKKICADFGLSATTSPQAQSEYLRRRAVERRELEAFRSEYNVNHKERRDFLRMERPSPEIAGEYGALMGRMEYLDYWFEQNPWR